MKFKTIQWYDEQEASEAIRYNHVIGTTPFGRFVITWKGWKKYNSPTIDETPWGDFGGVGNDVDDAKRIAEAEYLRRLNDCVAV